MRRDRLVSLFGLTCLLIGITAQAQVQCWAPPKIEGTPNNPKFARVVASLRAIEEIMKHDQAFLSPPEPERLRVQSQIGPYEESGVHIYIKAFPQKQRYAQIDLWGSKCEILPQAERVDGEDAAMAVYVNSNYPSVAGYSVLDRPLKELGRVGRFPSYEFGVSRYILISQHGAVPWVPSTVADLLDRQGKVRASELERAQSMHNSTDIAYWQGAIEAYKKYRASLPEATLNAPAHMDLSPQRQRTESDRIAALHRLPPAEQAQVDAFAQQGRALERQAAGLRGDPDAALKLRQQAAEIYRKGQAIKDAHNASVASAVNRALAEAELTRIQPATQGDFIKPNPNFPDRKQWDRPQTIWVNVWTRDKAWDPAKRQWVPSVAHEAWSRNSFAELDLEALAKLVE